MGASDDAAWREGVGVEKMIEKITVTRTNGQKVRW